MSKITLPRYHWFISGSEKSPSLNTYSASLGTVTGSGCLGARTFNYRVYVKIDKVKETVEKVKDDGEKEITEVEKQIKSVVAECFIIQPWSEGGNKTDNRTGSFECSPDGVIAAQDWLSDRASELGF